MYPMKGIAMDNEIFGTDVERLKKLLDIVKQPTEEDIVCLAQVFYSSTVLSKGINWQDLVKSHPAKVIFFTGGIARVLMYLKMAVLCGGETDGIQRSGDDNLPQEEVERLSNGKGFTGIDNGGNGTS